MTGIWILDLVLAVIAATVVLGVCHRLMMRFGWAPTNNELDKLEADLKRKREEEQ